MKGITLYTLPKSIPDVTKTVMATAHENHNAVCRLADVTVENGGGVLYVAGCLFPMTEEI